MTSPSLPLKGLRVLDFSRILAGPFCTMMMGDLGAEVIKVESVNGGDDTRSWGPPYSEVGHESSYFLGINRNKKSIAIDLKTAKGKEIALQLARTCDFAIENFPPGKPAKLGVSYDDLSRVNPGIVYGSLTGYGQTGPRSNQLAYDVMVSAIGGLMGITGPSPGAEPCKVGVAITDICAGLVLHGALLAAYIHVLRQQAAAAGTPGGQETVRGQWVETSLLNTQVAALANVASAYLVAGSVLRPGGTSHKSIVPYQAFECKDSKFIIVGALNDLQWRRLCKALSLEHLAHAEGFATNPQRVKNREELISTLCKVFKEQHTSDEWLALLESPENNVPCAPINSVDDVFKDKQIVHSQRVMQVEHPTVGMFKMVASPMTFHQTPLTRFDPPPLHGQHTNEILSNMLKYSTEDIARLDKEGVVKCHHLYQ